MPRRALPLLFALLVLPGCGAQAARPSATPPTPAPATAAAGAAGARLAPPRPAPGGWAVAQVVRPARLRARPGGRVLARLGTRTEFGSPRVQRVLRRRGAWLEVLAAELPNGRTGWLPASATRAFRVAWSLRVDRSRRRLIVRHAGRTVRSFPVAVGAPGTPTPLGRYALTDKLRTPGASPYGCCILALTGHQTRLDPGWVGGDRLAVHGTSAPATIGTAASHGCLRADERDLRRLLRALPLGTPVFIGP